MVHLEVYGVCMTPYLFTYTCIHVFVYIYSCVCMDIRSVWSLYDTILVYIYLFTYTCLHIFVCMRGYENVQYILTFINLSCETSSYNL